MKPLLYDELVDWYLLVDPIADHEDEAQCFDELLRRGADGAAETLLELGSGAGNNAYYLRQRYRCTLSDISEPMLALNRRLNPDCEHVSGDMRTLRLERSFDCVLVHDAVVYMLGEADLRAAARTAFEHTRPGGAALFAPDEVRETFREHCNLIETDEGERSLRCLEWHHDPDPDDSLLRTDMALLLRDGDGVRAVHDTHVSGVFARQSWIDVLSSVGYDVELVDRPIGDGQVDQIFLCRRPRAYGL